MWNDDGKRWKRRGRQAAFIDLFTSARGEEGASEAGDMEGGYEDLCIYVGRAFLDYIVLSRGFKLQARLRPRSQ
jgi:hypothetical protein